MLSLRCILKQLPWISEAFLHQYLKANLFSRTWTRPGFLIIDKEDASVDLVLRPNFRWRGTMGVSGETGVSTQSGSRSVESSASLSSLKPIAQSSSSTSTVRDVFNEFCWEIRQSLKVQAAVKIHWMIWPKGGTAQSENMGKNYSECHLSHWATSSKLRTKGYV